MKCNMPPVFLIGDCLQERAIAYCSSVSNSLKLSDALARVGYRLPSPAPVRAQGQLALLRAMSAAIPSVHASVSEPSDERPPFSR